MMTRIHGKIVFECDGCSEVLEPGTGDFGEAREVLNQERWRPYKVGDIWCHNCPECD